MAFAASDNQQLKKGKKQDSDYGTEGMCLGMCFGTAIGTAIGNATGIGMLLGLFNEYMLQNQS